MKTILVPVDLSAASTAACDAACDLARLMDARVLLLHVVQPPPVMVAEIYGLDVGQTEEMLVAAEQAGTDRLRELAARCQKRGVDVKAVHRVGLPVGEILARAAKADYIVMGSHGHGAVYDLLVGSTTHGVLKEARCPVVVVPSPRPARR
jgi:nucleotide-binding universal stress UspA family protein